MNRKFYLHEGWIIVKAPPQTWGTQSDWWQELSLRLHNLPTRTSLSIMQTLALWHTTRLFIASRLNTSSRDKIFYDVLFRRIKANGSASGDLSEMIQALKSETVGVVDFNMLQFMKAGLVRSRICCLVNSFVLFWEEGYRVLDIIES